MAIADELDGMYKDAMRARDQPKLDVIRMIRSKIGEAKTAKGFDGEVNDELYLRVIGLYVKQMNKALPDYEGQGERGREMVAQLKFEVDFLSQFLPTKLGEEETRSLVQRTVAELGVDDPKQLGRVMGSIMKDHRDTIDAGLVRRLIQEALGG